jgi:hypothetical protein
VKNWNFSPLNSKLLLDFYSSIYLIYLIRPSFPVEFFAQMVAQKLSRLALVISSSNQINYRVFLSDQFSGINSKWLLIDYLRRFNLRCFMHQRWLLYFFYETKIVNLVIAKVMFWQVNIWGQFGYENEQPCREFNGISRKISLQIQCEFVSVKNNRWKL